MDCNDQKIQVELTKITELLEEAISIYRQDRDLSIQHYNSLKEQLDNVIDSGEYMSEDASLERAVNAALRLVFDSSKRLDKAMESITKLSITQLINDARLEIADKFMSGNAPITGPLDFKRLTEK